MTLTDDTYAVEPLDEPAPSCTLCLGAQVCPHCKGTGLEPDDDELTQLRHAIVELVPALRAAGDHATADRYSHLASGF